MFSTILLSNIKFVVKIICDVQKTGENNVLKIIFLFLILNLRVKLKKYDTLSSVFLETRNYDIIQLLKLKVLAPKAETWRSFLTMLQTLFRDIKKVGALTY